MDCLANLAVANQNFSCGQRAPRAKFLEDFGEYPPQHSLAIQSVCEGSACAIRCAVRCRRRWRHRRRRGER